jgi:serine/threonine-protein kinase RsbW
MDSATTLVIPADLGEIGEVTTALDRAMRACGFTDDAIHELQLAVEEAIANTIVHGYHGSLGDVAVAIRVTDESAEVQIEDRAPRFNPLTFPEPDRVSDLDERPIGGLGIYLIRSMADEVVYHYATGKNILLLIKRRSARSTGG